MIIKELERRSINRSIDPIINIGKSNFFEIIVRYRIAEKVFSTRLPPEILETCNCQCFQRVHPGCQYTLFPDARIPA